MKDIRIYISGLIGNGQMPTPEQKEAAEQKFEYYEKQLREMGYIPVNPMKQGFTKLMGYSDILDVCKTIIRTQCRGILMLKDWRQSNGAEQERNEAILNLVPVYYEADGGLHQLHEDAKHVYKLQEEVV